MHNYLLVFANCFLTKGAFRSSIFDYQREDIYFIDNLYYDFLMQCKTQPLQEVIDLFRTLTDEEELIEFIAFCEQNELAFRTKTPQYFTETEVHFEHPSLITNAIIDVNAQSKHNYPQLFQELQTVACKDVQVRIFDPLPLSEIELIIQSFRINQHSQSLELIVHDSNELTDEILVELTHKYIYIKSIVVHSSSRNELFKIYSHAVRAGMGNIIFTSQLINSDAHCGIIHQAGFNYNNIAAYMEARLYNSCLNKKIGIDVNGLIKNCPSQVRYFGKLGQDKMLDIATNEDFQKLWMIKKDEVNVCKDCEFRYICSDCRIFLSDAADPYSKPMKCNYDPYTGSWN